MLAYPYETFNSRKSYLDFWTSFHRQQRPEESGSESEITKETQMGNKTDHRTVRAGRRGRSVIKLGAFRKNNTEDVPIGNMSEVGTVSDQESP